MNKLKALEKVSPVIAEMIEEQHNEIVELKKRMRLLEATFSTRVRSVVRDMNDGE
jgi:hypothetical protein